VVFDGTPRVGGEDVPDPRTLTAVAARLLDDAITDVRWAEVPPGVERVRYRAPSGMLAGHATGDPRAPRIVLVPGVTGSKEDFVLMAPLLARAGYRVESFDLAGQYESWEAGPERLVPPRARYDHDLFVDDLVAVLTAGGTPAHVLGYSFAGTIAQLVAVRHPELVASLTLLSTPPVSGQVFRKLASVKGLGAFVSHFANDRQSAAVFLWGVRRNLQHAPEHRLEFVRHRLQFTRRSAIDDIHGLMRHTPDVEAEVRALDIPKLVAFGTHDTWSPRLHRAFAARIGAEAVEYPTGHSPCETTPHQLARDMVRVIEHGPSAD